MAQLARILNKKRGTDVHFIFCVYSGNDNFYVTNVFQNLQQHTINCLMTVYHQFPKCCDRDAFLNPVAVRFDIHSRSLWVATSSMNSCSMPLALSAAHVLCNIHVSSGCWVIRVTNGRRKKSILGV